MKTEQEKILEIHLRNETNEDCSWSELAVATALEYGRSVRNETLNEAAAKVKVIIDEARVEYFARKFFPHLTPTYGRLSVIEIMRANLSPNAELIDSAGGKL